MIQNVCLRVISNLKIDLTGKQVLDEKKAEGPRVSGSFVDHAIPSIQATYEKPLSDCGTIPKEKSSNYLWMLSSLGIIQRFHCLTYTLCVSYDSIDS